MFRVFIPGIGTIFVNAPDEQTAYNAAQEYVRRNNLADQTTEDALARLAPVAFSSGSRPQGGTVVNHLGQVTIAGTTAPGTAVQEIQGSTDPDLLPGDTVPPSQGMQPTTPAVTQGGTTRPAGVPSDWIQAEDGTWVPPSFYQDTAANTGGAANIGAATPANLLERELADPAAAIRSFLEGRGAPGGGVLGESLQRAASPAVDIKTVTEGLQGALGTLPETGQTITDFLNQSIGGQGVIRSLGAQAQNALRGLAGLTADAQGNFGSAQGQLFNRPSSFGSDEAQAVRGALRAALAGRSPFLAAQFGSQLDDELGRRFGDQTFRIGQPGSFTQFGLENFGIR